MLSFDSTELINLSKKIAQENGIGNCHFIRQHSMDVRSPSKVDLVISETLGNYALEENILEIMHDAKRFLRPGGRMIPQTIRQFVCPIISSRIHDELDIWHRIPLGLDFGAARSISLHNIYVRRIGPQDLLTGRGAIRQWDTVALGDDGQSMRDATVEWVMGKKTDVEGFAVWWECDLTPGITLSTSPLSPATHWEQIYLPLLRPIRARKGETIRLTIHSDSRMEVKISIDWSAAVLDARGNTLDEQSLSMQKGFVGSGNRQ